MSAEDMALATRIVELWYANGSAEAVNEVVHAAGAEHWNMSTQFGQRMVEVNFSDHRLVFAIPEKGDPPAPSSWSAS